MIDKTNPQNFVNRGYEGNNDPEKQLDVIDPELAEKLAFIIDAIGCCISRRMIIKEFKKKFCVETTQAYRYFNTAMLEMQDELKKSRSEHIAESIASSRTILKRALAKGDHNAANSSRRYIDAVIGLTQPFNEQGNPTNGSVSGGTPPLDEQSARDLAKIIARGKAAITETQPPVVDHGEYQDGGRKAV